MAKKVMKSWRAKPAPGFCAGMPHGSVTALLQRQGLRYASCAAHQCEDFGMSLVEVWEFGCPWATVSEVQVQTIGVHPLCGRLENAANGAKFLLPACMQTSH